MNLILFMAALALLLASAFTLAYFWALSDEQFDDLETPAHRILKDEVELLNNVKGKIDAEK